jgi:hypothetical protein
MTIIILFRLWSRHHTPTPHLLQKYALSTDFYIGICINAQLCWQASISDAALFSRSLSPMGRQNASPHSRDCGEGSFMARVGCQVSLPSNFPKLTDRLQHNHNHEFSDKLLNQLFQEQQPSYFQCNTIPPLAIIFAINWSVGYWWRRSGY